MRMGCLATGWLACALLIAAGGATARAQQATPASVTEFYKGRTVFISIGFATGGTYDLYARLIARHIGRHIPGNPVIVAQSMPGAGSLKAANYIYAVAPRDGFELYAAQITNHRFHFGFLSLGCSAGAEVTRHLAQFARS